MNLKEEILEDFSKQYVVYLAKKIGANQELFDELMILFLGKDYRITQRAAWILSHCFDENPWLINKHLKVMIDNLKKQVDVAVKRNTVKVLQHVDIPDDLLGDLAEICFGYLNSGKEAVAVKAHSMTILFNIVKKFPELKDELKLSIEDQMPYESAGFKARGRKILKALERMSYIL